jgi:hypothetical protein
MTIRNGALLASLVALLSACAKTEKTCSSGLADCNGTCTSLVTDLSNCGACGHACGAGEQCSGGLCRCRDGRVSCGGACVDLPSNPDDCGACGVACAGALVCTTSDAGATSCAASCLGAGQVACNRACVNLLSNSENCGACGRVCGSNEHCSSGRCLADLYLACFNTDDVREATAALEPAGVPLPVATGPGHLAWAGDLLAVASATAAAETLGMVHFDLPRIGYTRVHDWTVGSGADIEYLAEHDGLLYVSRASLGTLLIATPQGAVVDQIRLAPVGDPAPGPQGIAFDGEHAFVALNAADQVVVLDVSGVPSCASGTTLPPCTSELARVDVHPLASPPDASGSPVSAGPTRIAVTGGRAYVALWNLAANWSVPVGSTGRLAAISTTTLDLDAAFAGTANGLIDLGPDCLDPADVAVYGNLLYVSCTGAWGAGGNGIARVDVFGSYTQLLPMILFADSNTAPGKIAFCGGTGYVGDQATGSVFLLDPASAATVLGSGVDLCPNPGGFEYVPDIACGR